MFKNRPDWFIIMQKWIKFTFVQKKICILQMVLIGKKGSSCKSNEVLSFFWESYDHPKRDFLLGLSVAKLTREKKDMGHLTHLAVLSCKLIFVFFHGKEIKNHLFYSGFPKQSFSLWDAPHGTHSSWASGTFSCEFFGSKGFRVVRWVTHWNSIPAIRVWLPPGITHGKKDH